MNKQFVPGKLYCWSQIDMAGNSNLVYYVFSHYGSGIIEGETFENKYWFFRLDQTRYCFFGSPGSYLVEVNLENV